MNSCSLEHHGIEGQKWGIRRYQNPDGTLTPEGKERYAKFANPTTKPRHESYPTRYENGRHILPKDTRIYRFASSKENIDEKRKYASITDRDRQMYEDWAREGYFASFMEATEFTYKTTKDLNIVGGQKVMNHLLKEYGDKSIKNTYRIYKELQDLPQRTPASIRKLGGTEEDVEVFEKAQDAYKQAENALTEFAQKSLFRDQKTSSETFKHFQDKGYDAIVDAEDWIGDLVDFPIILLNPKESITLESKKSMW